LELRNEFLVNTSAEAAWPILLDVARIAGCVPGGELVDKLDERSFKGRVSIKLGPMMLAFEGIAKFTDIDAANRRARIEARGSDKKGRGAAQANVTMQLVRKDASTLVQIATDLQLSGPVAQIGRASSLIEDVSQQIVGEFAGNLNRQIGAMAATQATNAAGPQQTASQAAPISGFRFAARVLWAALGRRFGKSTEKPEAKP
jgi:carbon monoxide dehydrogenase subunit G